MCHYGSGGCHTIGLDLQDLPTSPRASCCLKLSSAIEPDKVGLNWLVRFPVFLSQNGWRENEMCGFCLILYQRLCFLLHFLNILFKSAYLGGVRLKNKHTQGGWEDGGEKGGSRVHFSLGTGETPSWSSEKQSEQPTVFQHIWRLQTKNCRGHWKITW